MMSSTASTSMKKGTHATMISTGGNYIRRAPALVVSVLAVSLALCATSQVFCSKLNKTVMP